MTPTVASDIGDRLLADATRIGEEVAGPAADDVDRRARFPVEAVEALREAKLLSVSSPPNSAETGRRSARWPKRSGPWPGTAPRRP